MIYYSKGFPVLRYKLFDLKQPEISKEHQQDLLPLVYSQVIAIVTTITVNTRVGILKLSRSPRIDSKEPIQ
jgi:hypothetical protein